MGFGAKLVISRDRDLINSLALLDRKATTIARRAVAKALGPVRSTARRLAPRDSGLLRRAIKSRAYVTRDKSAVIGEVSAHRMPAFVLRRGRKTSSKANPAFYAHLVELGTRRHFMKIRKSAKMPRIHPGARAQAFFRPALEQNEQFVNSTIKSVVDTELEATWNG